MGWSKKRKFVGGVGGSSRVEEPMLVGMGWGGDGAVYSVVGA